MAYIALYRKWRPKTFTDVVGQKQVSETLMRAIRENKVAHAYLFSGPRGTGKTSLAKIFARAINCVHGPTDHPCNECPTCLQILQGDSMDVIEIDAASNRGIDEVRALRENVKFLPVEGRKKIFIIDEAHMLTTEAWNALLKTIEEPPDHVMFIFATTEPEKLPVTILSRCQRYAFRRITAADISEHLLRVAKESDIDLSPKAAKLIAVQADGGLRDALSILDQCSGMTDGTITDDAVEDMMGLVSRADMTDFFAALHGGDGAKVLWAVKENLMRGREAVQIPDALAEHIRALMLCKVMPNAEELSLYEDLKARLQEQANQTTVAELESYMRSLRQMQSDAKRTDAPRIIIEMGLLGICARRNEEQDSLESRVTLLEAKQGMADDGVRNRLARLESGQEVVNRDNNGANEVPTAPQMATFAPAAQTGPAQQAPVSLPPAPKRRAPKAPPKRRGDTEASGTTELFSATNSPDIAGVVIGKEIRPSSTYRDLQGKALQWLDSKAMNMCSSFYKSAQLVYVDEARAVVTFNQSFNITMATKPHLYSEAVKAFAAVIGAPVQLQVVLYNSEEDKAYRAAANGQAVPTGTTGDPSPASSKSGKAALPNNPSENSGKSTAASVADTTADVKKRIQPPPLPITEEFEIEEVPPYEEIPPHEEEAAYEEITEVPPIEDFLEDATLAMPPSGTAAAKPQNETGSIPDSARKWVPERMTEEEKQDPLLATALEKLAQTHDIYVDTVEDNKEEE